MSLEEKTARVLAKPQGKTNFAGAGFLMPTDAMANFMRAYRAYLKDIGRDAESLSVVDRMIRDIEVGSTAHSVSIESALDANVSYEATLLRTENRTPVLFFSAERDSFTPTREGFDRQVQCYPGPVVLVPFVDNISIPHAYELSGTPPTKPWMSALVDEVKMAFGPYRAGADDESWRKHIGIWLYSK